MYLYRREARSSRILLASPYLVGEKGGDVRFRYIVFFGEDEDYGYRGMVSLVVEGGISSDEQGHIGKIIGFLDLVEVENRGVSPEMGAYVFFAIKKRRLKREEEVEEGRGGGRW
ncbi:hypothetical protein L6452_37178 [Arctium lappa]|uniref:Uncharacterized protein n=1 Tax=Arctium lappa TaxID=4217 RepID=A0ACB8Y271_ARCLA|nr:hypothetical protein L6452_37178 [Arctium lappa]